MHAEIAEKWIAALTSGEYKQGTSTLENGNGEFCCLGVLCTLAAKEGIGNRTVETYTYEPCGCSLCSDVEPRTVTNIKYSGETAFLPVKVMEWAGMETCNGEVSKRSDDGNSISLVYLNDGLKYDFNQIAEFIRDNVNEL